MQVQYSVKTGPARNQLTFDLSHSWQMLGRNSFLLFLLFSTKHATLNKHEKSFGMHALQDIAIDRGVAIMPLNSSIILLSNSQNFAY